MKQHPLLRHLIQMRRLGYFTPVTTKVIPRDVIGDKKNKVRLLGLDEGSQSDGENEEESINHLILGISKQISAVLVEF